MGRLENKVALITGGAMGMGEADSKLFAKEGAKVIIADIAEDLGKAKAEEIGDNAYFLKLDISSEEDWKNAADYIKENFGKLDILINNAGIADVNGSSLRTFPNIDYDDWQRMFDVDAKSMAIGIQTMFPLMKEHGGSIVNIGSTAGLEGMATPVEYSAAKWAVRGITKSVAQVYGAYNIRCNCLHPGFINTRLTADLDAAGLDVSGTVGNIPLGRYGDTDEIANTTLFLASDESSYITGIDIPVDGGFTNAGLYYAQLQPILKANEENYEKES